MAYKHIKLSEFMSFKHYDAVKPSDVFVGFTWRINDRPYIGQVAKAFKIIGVDYKINNDSLTNRKEVRTFHYEETQFIVDDD